MLRESGDIREMIQPGILTDEISEDFELAVKIALENGIRNLEIRGVWGKNVGNLKRKEVDRIKSIVDNYGVKIVAIASPFLKCSICDVTEYLSHIKILDNCIFQSHKYGTNIIRIFTFWRLEPVERYWDSMLEKLRIHVKRAEKEGVILAVEPEPGTNVARCSELRKLFDDIPSESLKATWDVANTYFEKGVRYPDDYTFIRGKVVHVHVKDLLKDSCTGEYQLTYIGKGIIPYEDIFHNLLKDGFDGVASIEAGTICFDKRETQSITRQIRSLRNLLAKIQS